MLTRWAYQVSQGRPQFGRCVCLPSSLNWLLYQNWVLLPMIQVFTAFWEQYQSTFSHFSKAVLGTDLLNVQCNSSNKILNRIQILSFFLSWTLIKIFPVLLMKFRTQLKICNMQHCLPCKFSFYTYNKSTHSPHLSNTNVLLKLAKGSELYIDLTIFPQLIVLYLGTMTCVQHMEYF